jgi:hypothetical protein
MGFLKYFANFKFLYLLFGGLFCFLISITFDVIFIPTIDMPGNWCKKWHESKIGYRAQEECVEFRSRVDELKYRHNQKMEMRRTAKTSGLFMGAVVLTFLIMLLSPGTFVEHKITFENYSGAVAVAVFYGVIIGFLLPVLFEVLLPPPEEWLPGEFYEIRKARIEWVLKEITAESG